MIPVAMRIFGPHRHSERWHRDIDSHLRATGLHPDPENYSPKEQPWVRMRRLTDRYLARKNDVSWLGDEYLRKLIVGHGRKDIAIIACGHAMSAEALEQLLLSDDLTHINDLGGLRTFFQCIHAASLVNGVVSNGEGKEALRLSKQRSVPGLSQLEHLIRLSSEAQSNTFLTYERINAMITTKWGVHVHRSHFLRVERANEMKYLQDLNSKLEGLRRERNWLQAHLDVKWLSKFYKNEVNHIGGDFKSRPLLDGGLVRWSAWAKWEPNVTRIAAWVKLNDKERERLGHIVDLDGPDFDSDGKTLGKSQKLHQLHNENEVEVPIRFNSLTDEACRDMAERLLCLLENIVRNRPDDLALFLYKLGGPIISKQNLILMEKLTCGDFATISVSVAEAYSLRGATAKMQSEAVRRLIKLLNFEKFSSLRDVFTIDLAVLAIDLIRAERVDLLTAVQGPLEFRSFRSYEFFCEDLQKATWLWPYLQDSFPKLMEGWPTADDLRILHYIYNVLYSAPAATKSSIEKLIRSYILDNPTSSDGGSRALINSLIRLWRDGRLRRFDEARRSIALSLIPGAGSITTVRCACIEQLISLPERFVHSLWRIIKRYEADLEDPELCCVEMAKLLAETSPSMNITNWRPMFHRMIVNQGEKLFEHVAKDLPLSGYIHFLEDLEVLYGSSPSSDDSKYISVFKPGLLAWARLLLPYADLIESFRAKIECFEPIRCLYFEAVGQVSVQNMAKRFLAALSQHTRGSESDELAIRASLLDHISWSDQNLIQILNALNALNRLSVVGFEVCVRLHYLFNSTTGYVIHAFRKAWLSDPSLSERDSRALEKIFLEGTNHPPGWIHDKGLPLAVEHLDTEYADLLDEARRLAAFRASLKTVDLEGVTELLSSIDIEDSTPVEDVLASLPPEVLNAVEIVGEKEVEILFPLTHFTHLQRTALGIETAQSFVLLLELCDHYTRKERFCIHFNTESNRDIKTLPSLDDEASPWSSACQLGGKEMKSTSCNTSLNLFKNHFSRWLSRLLKSTQLGKDLISLSELHSQITHYLKDIGGICIICGKPHPISLRRPTTCSAPGCILTLNHSPQVLTHLIPDRLSFDLLLTSIYAAASTGNMALLPDCPIKDPQKVVSLIDQLPPIQSVLNSSQTNSTPSNNLGPLSPISVVIKYLLTTYNSFLVSATSSSGLKVPSMPPGTLQFVLASSTPEREALFHSQLNTNNNETRILFHGTSPDRLFSILCQGLKILSDTPLQAHGSVRGKGIYLADEPSTSYPYCTKPLLPTGNWKGSEFKNGNMGGNGYKVLLGCEHTGPRLVEGNNKVHVVREGMEGTVMVRYVFLIPTEVTVVPVARHLVPAMGSVVKGLRLRS